MVKAALNGQLKHRTQLSEKAEIEKEFLTPSPNFSTKWLDRLHPKIPLNPTELAPQVPEPPLHDPRVRVHLERSGLEGRINSIKLLPVAFQSISSASGMSLSRRMGSQKNAVRGKAGQMPFTPGGLDISEAVSASNLHRDSQGLLDVAPGLSRSAIFETSKNSPSNVLLGDDSLKADSSSDESDLDTETNSDDDAVSIANSDKEERLKDSKYNNIDDLLPPTSSFVREITKRIDLRKAPKEKTWAHMVDINRSMANFSELVPNPARTWPFELDNFQKEAVYHLEQGDSVFIAAHTSAGKTVVAEYAMSMAAQHMTKCIYTSPIKALSNQKYRDFKQEYDDVGILTGDVQLNPEASTLIMTTEILRSMLYRGADIIRDVEFIVFDEVHYVNDSDRGVVWEEVIIMLPDHVKLVLLSATVPNTFEFANWVGRTKEKDVYVISTPKRPVPLQHQLWLKKQVLEVVGADRKFNLVNYKKAQDLIAPKKEQPGSAQVSTRGGTGNARGGSNRGGTTRGGARGGPRGGASGKMAMNRQLGPQKGRFNSGPASKTDILSLVEHLRTNKLLPSVFFVFSRKLCEQFAEHMQSVSLNTTKEKSQVYMFMDKAVSRLRKEDRDLPQIHTLRTLLQQGIGVHHSGLLPIMKEVVEILFAKGLVKLLFATETFAMGLNLPTRTVVFTSVKKFDSKVMRFLSPGEYTQMAGRAGRRGLDTVGTVIVMNTSKDEIVPSSQLEQMMLGKPLKLSSQFRLTYNMILSLLRIEALKVEDVIQQSFSEDRQHVMRPERERRVIALEKILREERTALETERQKFDVEEDIVKAMTEYYNAAKKYHELTWKVYKDVEFRISPTRGRFAFYRSKSGTCLNVGLIYRCRISQAPDSKEKRVGFAVLYIGNYELPTGISFLTTIVGSDILYRSKLRPSKELYNNFIFADSVELISNVLIPVNVNQLDTENRDTILQLFDSNLDSMFTEVSTAKVSKIEARLDLRYREQMIEQMRTNGASLISVLFDSDEMNGAKASKRIRQGCETLYDRVGKICSAEEELANIKIAAASSNTALLPDYEQRMNVLKAGNYVDEELNVALKGRVACEISTGYELYVTELIMDNFLGSYEPEEIVALLSAFVFEGTRGAVDPATVTPRLDEGKARLLELVDYVHSLADKFQVPLTQDEADFAENNRFALMQVVYEWARGMTFSEITTLTTIQEGLIVRVINRLDEVCRSVMSAARIIGEATLYDKLAIAQERIKRDIVFCSSLYL